MYKLIIRPLLFLMNPEKAHHFTFDLIKITFKIPGVKTVFNWLFNDINSSFEKELMGLRFPNPIGLAAGFDKDAKLVDELSAFGFGFIEIGTVTPVQQDGNPKPRMFRLPLDNGLINRMGFNNEGVDAAAKNLKRRKGKLIIGGNIGKNKFTSNENAIDDYLLCYKSLYPVVDYYVVNVSSPNTPGLRALQEKEPLTNLLHQVQLLNQSMSKPRPLLLKIAPDLSNEQLDEIVEIVLLEKLDGIIATNTTITRTDLKTNDKITIEAGGLSGKPVKDRSTFVISYLRKKAGSKLVIIGVGGIFTAKDAKEKLDAGADLLQVYTGFIYEGPALVKNLLAGLK